MLSYEPLRLGTVEAAGAEAGDHTLSISGQHHPTRRWFAGLLYGVRPGKARQALSTPREDASVQSRSHTTHQSRSHYTSARLTYALRLRRWQFMTMLLQSSATLLVPTPVLVGPKSASVGLLKMLLQ